MAVSIGDITTSAAAPARRLGRKSAYTVFVLAVAAIVYVFIPRHGDLRAFDPASLARAETAMWRNYYEKRYVRLFLGIYLVARDEQKFSPWESLSLALAAARAAGNFQPSRSRAEADAALPHLTEYYRILSRAAPVAVDPEKVAQTELDWWQARRAAIKPEVYGRTVARVSSMLYGIDNDDIRTFGIMRAQAMAYRDARAGNMTEVDWASITEQLTVAYILLKESVGPR